MRLRALSFVILAVVLFSMPLMAADASTQPVQKSFRGAYWEPKPDVLLLFGTAFYMDGNGIHTQNWVPIGVGVWLGGWREDRILLGNIAVNFVVMNAYDTETPKTALGFTVTPVGFCLGADGWFKYRKLRKGGDTGWYLKPTYTYLVGLNGRIAHQSSFGVQMSFAWKR